MLTIETKPTRSTITNLEPIPVVNSTHALQSLRDSGYDLPTALAEPIDNSIEAGASNINIFLEEGTNKAGKKHVHRILISDDGSGMSADLLQKYLVVGFSTRYMKKDTMGKYGVGAKLAAMNFFQRIDAWSKNSKGDKWLHSYFDLEEELIAQENALKKNQLYQAMVNPPDELKIPIEFQQYIPNNTGTLIIWSKSDRLEEGRFAEDFEMLREEIKKELSRIFRNFIDGGISVTVNGTKLIPYDPLFLMEGHWGDFILNKEAKSEKKPKHFEGLLLTSKNITIDGHNATVKVTLYPRDVIRKRGKGGDELAKKLRIPENEGRISFVRLGREVAYARPAAIFPSRVTPADRFIGIEVSFTPELDSYFGVRNVKRGVEPHGELRQKIRNIIEDPIERARKERDEIWDKHSQVGLKNSSGVDPITEAVKDADRTMVKGKQKAEDQTTSDEEALKDLAADIFPSDEKAQETYINEVKEKEIPFVVEPVSWPGPNFIDIIHTELRIIIRLNKRHKFYQEMYQPLKEICANDISGVSHEDIKRRLLRSLEALTLMIIAYAKAESMNEKPEQQYSDLRLFWGQFLHTLMGRVKDVL